REVSRPCSRSQRACCCQPGVAAPREAPVRLRVARLAQVGELTGFASLTGMDSPRWPDLPLDDGTRTSGVPMRCHGRQSDFRLTSNATPGDRKERHSCVFL